MNSLENMKNYFMEHLQLLSHDILEAIHMSVKLSL